MRESLLIMALSYAEAIETVVRRATRCTHTGS